MPSGSNSTISDHDEAEQAGLQARRPGDRRRQVVAHERDGLRQAADEDGAQDGAVDRAEAAHHHHQQQLDRQQDVEGVGRDEAHLVAEQRAGEAGDAGAQREGDGLVAARG